jgi:hypothetical protein
VPSLRELLVAVTDFTMTNVSQFVGSEMATFGWIEVG